MRNASAADAAAICGIYNHYIEHSTITFEEEAISPADMGKRIAESVAGSLPWLVEEADGNIVGYAYASKWKARAAYRFAVETTIYLAPDVQNRGIGTKLYEELLMQLRSRSMHVAIGGIALPNEASLRLHEKLGFQKVAEFIEVGFKFGRWINVGYWEKKL